MRLTTITEAPESRRLLLLASMPHVCNCCTTQQKNLYEYLHPFQNALQAIITARALDQA